MSNLQENFSELSREIEIKLFKPHEDAQKSGIPLNIYRHDFIMKKIDEYHKIYIDLKKFIKSLESDSYFTNQSDEDYNERE